uniref:Uncharacterized protein n=1 Tax=Romanomermis culicivorax TaxID=13658 RepID=A0A915KP90_ROMCU
MALVATSSILAYSKRAESSVLANVETTTAAPLFGTLYNYDSGNIVVPRRRLLRSNYVAKRRRCCSWRTKDVKYLSRKSDDRSFAEIPIKTEDWNILRRGNFDIVNQDKCLELLEYIKDGRRPKGVIWSAVQIACEQASQQSTLENKANNKQQEPVGKPSVFTKKEEWIVDAILLLAKWSFP